MKRLTLEEIREAVHGRWLRTGCSAAFERVCTDSREAHPGDLFIALRGERFDGHDFCAAAAQGGCVAAIVRRDGEPPPDVSDRFEGGLIGVADTTRALADLAVYQRRISPAIVIAVTGSNGKTTVKRMIHHVLSTRMEGTCSPKSFNNRIGVPLTLLGSRGGDDYVVCEIGTGAPGEVAALGALARPNVAVITNVAPAHLEGFGTLERIAAEKASLLGTAEADALAVVTDDSELLDRAMRNYPIRTVRFGESDTADLRMTGFETDSCGVRFQFNGRLWARLGLLGRHNARNALAAMGVAGRLGIGPDEAAAALESFQVVQMRLQSLRAGGLRIINDAYNANPASMIAAANVLADVPARRRVMIAGDMRELGDEAEALHRRVGEEIAARGIDLVIGVGLLGRYIAEGAASAGRRGDGFDLLEQARAALPSLLRDGDAVLVKGSRAMAMERLVQSIVDFFGGEDARKV